MFILASHEGIVRSDVHVLVRNIMYFTSTANVVSFFGFVDVAFTINVNLDVLRIHGILACVRLGMLE